MIIKNYLNKDKSKFPKFYITSALIFAFVVIFSQQVNMVSAGTGINQQIPYSGSIVNNAGVAWPDGNKNMKFEIYNVASGGSPIYTQIGDISGTPTTTVSIQDGRFDVLLGSITALPTLNDDSLYVQISMDADNNTLTGVGGYEEVFTPRRRIGSALSAINSLRLVANGGVSTNTLSLNSTGDLIFTGDSAIERMRITGTGNVGIGTTAPATALDINGAESMRGMAAPAVSVAGQGRIYFDSTTNTYRVSQNAGAYSNLGALSSLTAASATNTIDNLNFAQTWNWSTANTQTPLSVNTNALTTGSILSLATSNSLVNSTNGLLYVANTGAATTGTIARIQSNSTVGSGLTVLASGNVGIGTIAPTARLTLPAGTATANTSPLKFTAGTNLTTAEAGALEWDGTNLFLTTSGAVRQTINQGLTATAILNFPSTNNDSFNNLPVTVTGAALNDVVSLGFPNDSVPAAATNFSAWVSAANTVTVRFTNNSGVAQDPASGSFKVFVTK